MLFNDINSFNEDISSWNTSSVQKMDSMFASASAFNQPIGIWDTSRVTDMNHMFYSAASFNRPLNKWNTAKVTDLSGMFKEARSHNQSLESWDTGRVQNMAEMFYNAIAFNQPLSTWDTSKVTDMNGMFFAAESFNQPLASWNAGKVTDMKFLFCGAHSFNQPLSRLNTSKVTSMYRMFYYALAFNQSIGDWDTSQVTDMSFMFSFASAFNQFLGKWVTAQVSNMESMFMEASSFNQPVASWNISAVTDMTSMFHAATAFNQALGNWNLAGLTVTDMFLSAGAMNASNLPVIAQDTVHFTSTQASMSMSTTNAKTSSQSIATTRSSSVVLISSGSSSGTTSGTSVAANVTTSSGLHGVVPFNPNISNLPNSTALSSLNGASINFYNGSTLSNLDYKDSGNASLEQASVPAISSGVIAFALVLLIGTLAAWRYKCISSIRSRWQKSRDGEDEDIPLKSLSIVPSSKPSEVEACNSDIKLDYYFSYKAVHSRLQSQPLYVAMAIHDVLFASGYTGIFLDTLLSDEDGIVDALQQCRVLVIYIHDENLSDTRCQMELTTAGNLKIPILCIGDAFNFDLPKLRTELAERFPCVLKATWVGYMDSHRHTLQQNVCRWLSLNVGLSVSRAVTEKAGGQRAMPDGKSFHYFLSHKKKHSRLGFQPEALAMGFHDVLKCKGFQGFFDVDNLIRISKQDLENGVKSSCTLIIFLHDETCESEWCRYEWKIAQENSIPILCIVDIKNCSKNALLQQIASVNAGLLEYQWLDFFDEYRQSIQERAWAWVNQQLEAAVTGGDFVGLRSDALQLESVHLPGQIQA